MKKIILLTIVFSLSVSITRAQPQGFFLNDWQPKTIVSPEFINTPPTSETATVTVNVDFSNKIAKVSRYVYGNNSVPWSGKMNMDAALMSNIKNLSPNILRCPGGSLSDVYFWDAVEGKGPADLPPSLKVDVLNAGRNTSNWAMTLDNYYDMLEKTMSTGSICVNYSYARYGTSADPVANAAHYAANWVRYDKGRTKYWEIGNENMGSWEAGYEIDLSLNKDNQPKIISGELYGKHCRVFIDSMKYAASQIGSDIKIGVVATEGYISYNEVMKNWNAGMMPQIADKADFLIVHSYYTPYLENSTVATILNSAANTKKYKDYVLKDLKTYGKIDNLPVALTEYNIFAVGSKQAVSYINGIHTTLVLGELIKNQFGEATRWDLMNGWSDGDDHGMFASSDEPGVKLRTPHAPFFYMYYFQKYFGDQMVSSAVTGSNYVIAYASSFDSGQSGVVVVNKAIIKQVVNLQMNNFAHARSYYRYVLTGGTDNGNFSRKVYVNGNGPSGDGGGPDSYTTLKALGTSISEGIKFEAPPLSVTYLLVTNDSIKDITGINLIKDPSFTIYPNPTKGIFRIEGLSVAGKNQIIVQSMDGKLIRKKTGHSATETINISDQGAGTYLLRINKQSFKILKE